MNGGGDGAGAFSFFVLIEKYVSIFERLPEIVAYSIPDPFLKTTGRDISCAKVLFLQ